MEFLINIGYYMEVVKCREEQLKIYRENNYLSDAVILNPGNKKEEVFLYLREQSKLELVFNHLRKLRIEVHNAYAPGLYELLVDVNLIKPEINNTVRLENLYAFYRKDSSIYEALNKFSVKIPIYIAEYLIGEKQLKRRVKASTTPSIGVVDYVYDSDKWVF